jgi:hypothetical protein
VTWVVVAAILIAVAAAITAGVRAQRSRTRRPPAMEFIPLGETRRQLPVFDPGAPASPPTFVKEPGFEVFARPAAPDAICFLTGRVVETCTCAKHKAKGAKP